MLAPEKRRAFIGFEDSVRIDRSQMMSEGVPNRRAMLHGCRWKRHMNKFFAPLSTTLVKLFENSFMITSQSLSHVIVMLVVNRIVLISFAILAIATNTLHGISTIRVTLAAY